MLRNFPMDSMTKVVQRAASYKPLLQAIMLDQNTPNACLVYLHESQNQDTVFTYRGLNVSAKMCGDVPPRLGDNVETTTGAYQSLAKVAIDQPIRVLVFKRREDPPLKACAGHDNWGPLRLLLNPSSSAVRSADGKTWEVKYPFTDDGVKHVMTLELRFQVPLPELDKWPKQ
jgi:hypothetical protein